MNVRDLPLTTLHDLGRIIDATGIERPRVVAGDADSTTIVFSHDELTAIADRIEDAAEDSNWCPICEPAGL